MSAIPSAGPWPCRNADPSGTRRSSAEGPTRGTVGPRWSAPKGLRLVSGPVVGPAGRIALAIPDTVLIFPPDFRHPQALTFPHVRHLAFTASGDLLACGTQEARRIAPDGGTRPIPSGDAFEGKPPAALVELPGGDLFAWRDTQYARLDPEGNARYRGDLAKGMTWFGSQVNAVAPDGARAHAMAMRWVSRDEPTESYGALLAVSPDGIPFFRKDGAHDDLPTGDGFDLRLMALPEGILLAEAGAAFWDWDGTVRWRDYDYTIGAVVRMGPRAFAFARGGRHLLRIQVPEGTPERPPVPSPILELGKDDAIHDVVGDAAGRLYVAERATLVAVDERDKLRFRALLPSVQSLVVGEGFLLAVQQPLTLVRVD